MLLMFGGCCIYAICRTCMTYAGLKRHERREEECLLAGCTFALYVHSTKSNIQDQWMPKADGKTWEAMSVIKPDGCLLRFVDIKRIVEEHEGIPVDQQVLGVWQSESCWRPRVCAPIGDRETVAPFIVARELTVRLLLRRC